MRLPDQYPEILADLAELIYVRLCEHLSGDSAELLALDTTEAIRARFGGGLIYIPKGSDFARCQRNAAIVRKFSGNNHKELARQYGLGVAAIYDILANAQQGAC